MPLRILRIPLACALLAWLACAPGTGPSGSATGPAQPAPGWIEFVLEDRAIPADPLANTDAAPQPPTCDLVVLLNRESVISLTLRPRGDAPPYTLDSRFTIRAFPGDYEAVVHYSSCRNHGQRPDSLEVKGSLKVVSGHVTRATFDGGQLTSEWPEPPGSR